MAFTKTGTPTTPPKSTTPTNPQWGTDPHSPPNPNYPLLRASGARGSYWPSWTPKPSWTNPGGLDSKQRTNLSVIAGQMSSYLETLYGDIKNFTYQNRKWGSWDEVKRFIASGNSPYANDIASGKKTLDQWKTEAQKAKAGVPAGGGGTATHEQKDAYAQLLDTLNTFGLQGLGDWLWKEIINDTPESQIFLDLRKTDVYKARFPGMNARQQAGLPALSEIEYIHNEEAYRQILRNSGADPAKFSKPSDLLNFFVQDLHPDEVQQRADIWHMLTKSPQTAARVKGLFEQFTKIGNVSDDQLFQMLVENNNTLLNNLHQGLGGQGVQTLSVSNLKDQITKALQAEASTWVGGGGQSAQQGGMQTGVTGQRTERFT